MLSRVFFVGERFRDGELPEDSSLSARVSTLSGEISPFPLSWAIGYALQPQSRTSFPRLRFFSIWARNWSFATGHSHAISAWPDLATPSYVLLVSLAFSPCLDANGGSDLLEIGSSECSSSRLPLAI